MKNFEMANADDPQGIVRAAQKSVLTCLQQILADTKIAEPKIPGLTWEQLDYLIEHLKKKEPTIITQEHEL